MAIFNELQDKGQLTQMLQRRFNLTGAAPSPALEPGLFPCVVYENDRPEWGFLKGELPYSRVRTASASGGAGFSGVGLWNPATSGQLVVINEIRYLPLAAVTLVTSVSTVNPFSTSDAGYSRDTRYSTAASLRRSNCVLGLNTDYTDPSPLGALWQTSAVTGAQAQERYDHPIILKPGAQAILIGSVANTAVVQACFVWTERPALPGELG